MMLVPRERITVDEDGNVVTRPLPEKAEEAPLVDERTKAEQEKEAAAERAVNPQGYL